MALLDPTRKPEPLEFEKWELNGPTSLWIGDERFALPLGAQVKLRHPLVWVRVKGLVHCITELGDVSLTARQRIDWGKDSKWNEI